MAAALALCGGAAGCGTGENAAPTSRADGEPGGVRIPLQSANGPIAPAAGHLTADVNADRRADSVQIRFGRQPRAGLLFDLDTGRVLWRKDPTRILPIASVTKIMTALVVADRVPPDAKVRITKEALAYKGSGVGLLPENKWVGISAMLYGLLLPSGNDAAIALAQRAGEGPQFVAMMNARADAMGLTCTRYSTPSGFTDRGNASCAADLAVRAGAARRAAPGKDRRAARGRPAVSHQGRQALPVQPQPAPAPALSRHARDQDGLHRRSRPLSRRRRARNGHRLGVVLLHSPDPGGQAEKLFDRGFRAIA